MTLREKLIVLRDGGTVEQGRNPALANESNGYDESGITWLTFDDGRWFATRRNCFSDTCQCVSHSKYVTEQITRVEALVIMRSVIEAETVERIERDAEIAWLEAIIKHESSHFRCRGKYQAIFGVWR